MKMPDQFQIHDDIKLYMTADKFYLEPTIDPDQILVIDRISGAATVHDYGTVKIPIPDNCYKPVCGFLGTIKLISGYYLVVAKYRSLVGKINGHDVYKLAGHDLIPFARSTTHLTNRQIEDNSTYERMIAAALETPGIYFSYGHDMTHTLQRLHSVDPDFHKLSIAARADARFLWNSFLLKDFTGQAFARWALPIIQGFVSINRITVNGQQLSWTLISRRSIERAGTRLFIRGVDAQGNVANYVETEQIVEKGADKSSFVQTRGSIPLFWHQYPNLRLKPGITVVGAEHLSAYTTHLRDQLQRYGSQVLVNLIDQCGREQALEAGYRAAVAAAALPGVRYEPFDFHAECRRMRYDRLDILMHRVQHELSEFSYFLSRGGSVLRRQGGVFRTNCVDCLDRTNVVQSLLANTTLKSQLHAITVGHSAGQVPLHSELQTLFNGVWADHADMISTQYSGTGALKTDFTRTGKRTAMGALMDGVNSLTRYYKNNFCDGFRQDSIDLFLGRYVVAEGEGNTVPSPLRRHRDWKYVAVPSFMVVALGMFCASATLPSRYDSAVLLYLMFWGACLSLTLNYILKNGSDFVEWPRLDGGGLATTRAHGLSSSL